MRITRTRQKTGLNDMNNRTQILIRKSESLTIMSCFTIWVNRFLWRSSALKSIFCIQFIRWNNDYFAFAYFLLKSWICILRKKSECDRLLCLKIYCRWIIMMRHRPTDDSGDNKKMKMLFNEVWLRPSDDAFCDLQIKIVLQKIYQIY